MTLIPADAPFTRDDKSVVAIGVFDGVHVGHQFVIDRAVALARHHVVPCVVVTFDPTPAEVLAPDRAPRLLDTLEHRAELLYERGVDEVRVVAFSADAAQEEAIDFVRRVLVESCRAGLIVVGEDFHFGKNRGGNVATLTAWGEEFDFLTEPQSLVSDEADNSGERVSSTRIRECVTRGDVASAARMLGRPFGYFGAEVVHGDARGGAELGYPTANIAPSSRFLRPALGIYAGAARLPDGQRYAAAISVGRRPQFYENGDVLIEAYILDFSGDLYGQAIDLEFLEFLRPEMTFTSVEELVAQMALDVAATAEIYGTSGVESA